jgi:peptidyl-tRNA hydrolase
MDAANTSGDGIALPAGRFTGPTEFAAMIRLAFDAAASQGWREIILSDRSFEDWPLGERAVSQSLQEWSRSGRKLTMLAKSYDELIRRHARFVTWRRTWAHIIDCRSNTSIPADDFPSAIWSPVWVCQRLDLDRCTGISGAEPARRVLLRERMDECLRRSSAAFPATTLGI